MADSEPTVTVKLSDFDRLREQLREAQNRGYELDKQLVVAKLGDTSSVGQLLHDAFHSAIKVVQFAVGNLDPQTIAGWPHKALVEIANAIEKIPGVDVHVAEMPGELRHFAGLAAGYEEYRRERDKHKVVVPATAADFGPQTPEAAAVHAAYAQTVERSQTADEKSVVPHDSGGTATSSPT